MQIIIRFINIVLHTCFFLNLIQSQSTPIYFPILKNMSSIIVPSQNGILLKMRANTEYIFRLSTIGRLDIWSVKNYSLIVSLRSSTGVLINNLYPIIDFSIINDENQKIGILLSNVFHIYSITNNSFVFTYNYMPITFNNFSWRQVYITKKHISFLANDYFYRFNRTTMIQRNNFTLNFTFNTYVGDICQDSVNGEVYSFYSPYNRIKSFQCFDNTTNLCSLVYQNFHYSFIPHQQIDRIISSNDCSKIYIEADNFRRPSIQNIVKKNSSLFPFLGKIKSVSKFDQDNFYTLFILYNGSLFIFKNSTIISNIQYLGFNLANYTKVDIVKNQIYLASNTQIKIIIFQCGPLKYMYKTNLCTKCDLNCKNCNNINGLCNQCINSNYSLSNGQCIWSNILPPNQQSNNQNTEQNTEQIILPQYEIIINDTYALSPNYYYQNSPLIHVIMQFFSGTNNIISNIMIFVTVNPFGFIFLSFINFWVKISCYALLDISLPFYMKQILDVIYNSVHKSILSIFGDNLTFKNIIFGQNFKENINQKFNEMYTNVYGLSSNFLLFNIEHLLILIICLFILLLLFFGQKCLVNKKNWIFKKLQGNYLYFMFQQFSPFLAKFFFSSIVIISNNQQENFNQKINLVIIIFIICFSLSLPFLQLSSLKSVQKQNIKDKKLLNSDYKININRKISDKLRKKYINDQKRQQQTKMKFKKTDKQLVYAQKIELVYLMQCNIILPMSVMFVIGFNDFQLYFFILNFLLYGFGLYSSFIRIKYRLNYIIMNSYFLIFHFCCFMIWLIRQKIFIENIEDQQYLIYVFSIICLIFLTISAIHEVLFLLYEIIYYLYEIIKKKKLNKIKKSTKNIIVHQILQNKTYSQFNQKIKFKQKGTQYIIKIKNKHSIQNKLNINQINKVNYNSKQFYTKQHEQNNKQIKFLKYGYNVKKKPILQQKKMTQQRQSHFQEIQLKNNAYTLKNKNKVIFNKRQ